MNIADKRLEPFDSARSSTFMMMVSRLKAEHDRLKEQVHRLHERSLDLATATSRGNRLQLLEELRLETAGLLADLEQHAKWEDEELFPAVMHYFKRRMEPTMMPSMWVLEKDHELALQFFDSFMELSCSILADLQQDGSGNAADSYYDFFDVLKRAADHLTQACLILQGHFHMEEEFLFPLAEEILTDIDYLFS